MLWGSIFLYLSNIFEKKKSDHTVTISIKKKNLHYFHFDTLSDHEE